MVLTWRKKKKEEDGECPRPIRTGKKQTNRLTGRIYCSDVLHTLQHGDVQLDSENQRNVKLKCGREAVWPNPNPNPSPSDNSIQQLKTVSTKHTEVHLKYISFFSSLSLYVLCIFSVRLEASQSISFSKNQFSLNPHLDLLCWLKRNAVTLGKFLYTFPSEYLLDKS